MFDYGGFLLILIFVFLFDSFLSVFVLSVFLFCFVILCWHDYASFLFLGVLSFIFFPFLDS